MQLRDLLKALSISRVIGNDQIEVTGITADSRRVKPGDLFVCLTGFTVDGHKYATKAAEAGAIAILAEKEIQADVTTVYVPDTRRAMAILADLIYKQPSHEIKVIGVTGTNGKTTTTHIIRSIMEQAGYPTGVIGTIEMRIGDQVRQTVNTTPDAIDLQEALRWMADEGARYAAIEVSSHALDLGRVRGVRFAGGVFTNLSRDHLDYHQTMENYKQAKSLLFSQLGNDYEPEQMKYAVLNMDDPASEYFARVTSVPVVRYGMQNPGDITATDVKMNAQGTTFTLVTFKGSTEVYTPLMGMFNIYNILAGVGVCLMEGISLEQIKQGLANLQGVRGRFERVDAGQDYTVIVDYAHTPDGLENVLKTIDEFATGKVYCIVGCGGDRDRTKRPLMAQIAAAYSHVAVLTSDNPRSEEPAAIIDDMVAGLIEKNVPEEKYVTIVDRREAIRYTINQAKPGDVVLIAGKGHETYQIIKDKVHHFDDKEEAIFAILNKKKLDGES
jgi:UDP-N-acetylmuramoyl-L-alanyl-D-glutamate--2,6-diaminopimelate ligase